MEELKVKANENMQKREKELSVCHEILDKQWSAFQEVYHERQVIKAMQSVPQKVKEIRQHAIDNVFAKEVEGLDENSKEVLNKVLAYMEKKYISGPMILAKEIMMNNCLTPTLSKGEGGMQSSDWIWLTNFFSFGGLA